MKLLLSTPKRTIAPRWTCQSCRGIQTSGNARKVYNSLSTASKELRDGGPARTRFAPSPTGYLHLGSLRTALFNYLVAKASGGQFLLRIEDTDQKRTVEGAEERLFADLQWAGIEWDEGPIKGGPHGPYRQSERIALYRERAEQLLHSRHAYRCFCSAERLYSLAEYRSKAGLPPEYDRTCAHISKEESDDRASKGEAHVVRLKVPDKYPVFNDLVYGLVRQRHDISGKPRLQGSTLGSFDDPILLKSDGFPTYHLANVVDDHLMKITHVIRGSEWMSSTPKHLALYQAFDWEPPAFAHVGLLLDKDRQKLSKRSGSIDIKSWRDKGIFPETLTNFVALLGWSHNEGQDVMSMKDLIRHASMKYTRGDTVIGFEKLLFLQKRHTARYASEFSPPKNPLHDLTNLAIKPMVALLDQRSTKENFSFWDTLPDEESKEAYVTDILLADAQNYSFPANFIDRNIHFFAPPSITNLRSSVPALKLHNVPLDVPNPPDLTIFLTLFRSLHKTPLSNWSAPVLKERTNWIIAQGQDLSSAMMAENGSMQDKDLSPFEVRPEEHAGEKMASLLAKAWRKLVHGYLRWAVMGGRAGPDGSEGMRILGKGEVVRRLVMAEVVVTEAMRERALESGRENDGANEVRKDGVDEVSEMKREEA